MPVLMLWERHAHGARTFGPSRNVLPFEVQRIKRISRKLRNQNSSNETRCCQRPMNPARRSARIRLKIRRIVAAGPPDLSSPTLRNLAFARRRVRHATTPSVPGGTRSVGSAPAPGRHSVAERPRQSVALQNASHRNRRAWRDARSLSLSTWPAGACPAGRSWPLFRHATAPLAPIACPTRRWCAGLAVGGGCGKTPHTVADRPTALRSWPHIQLRSVRSICPRPIAPSPKRLARWPRKEPFL